MSELHRRAGVGPRLSRWQIATADAAMPNGLRAYAARVPHDARRAGSEPDRHPADDPAGDSENDDLLATPRTRARARAKEHAAAKAAKVASKSRSKQSNARRKRKNRESATASNARRRSGAAATSAQSDAETESAVPETETGTVPETVPDLSPLEHVDEEYGLGESPAPALKEIKVCFGPDPTAPGIRAGEAGIKIGQVLSPEDCADVLDSGCSGLIERVEAAVELQVDVDDRPEHWDSPDHRRRRWFIGTTKKGSRGSKVKLEWSLVTPSAVSTIFTSTTHTMVRGGAEDPELLLGCAVVPRRSAGGGGRSTPGALSPAASARPSTQAQETEQPTETAAAAAAATKAVAPEPILHVLCLRVGLHVQVAGMDDVLCDYSNVMLFELDDGRAQRCRTMAGALSVIDELVLEHNRSHPHQAPIMVSNNSLHTWHTVKSPKAAQVMFDHDLYFQRVTEVDKQVKVRIQGRFATLPKNIHVMLLACGDDTRAEQLGVPCPCGVRQPQARNMTKSGRGGMTNMQHNTVESEVILVRQYVNEYQPEMNYLTPHLEAWGQEIVNGGVCPVSSLPKGEPGKLDEPNWGLPPPHCPNPHTYRWPMLKPPTRKDAAPVNRRSALHTEQDGYSNPAAADQAPPGVAEVAGGAGGRLGTKPLGARAQLEAEQAAQARAQQQRAEQQRAQQQRAQRAQPPSPAPIADRIAELEAELHCARTEQAKEQAKQQRREAMKRRLAQAATELEAARMRKRARGDML
eukprot:COSAG01_NODE_6981_length_3405_cov_8.399879_2_plen_748_part_00